MLDFFCIFGFFYMYYKTMKILNNYNEPYRCPHCNASFKKCTHNEAKRSFVNRNLKD